MGGAWVWVVFFIAITLFANLPAALRARRDRHRRRDGCDDPSCIVDLIEDDGDGGSDGSGDGSD